jgi:hypothetical protein
LHYGKVTPVRDKRVRYEHVPQRVWRAGLLGGLPALREDVQDCLDGGPVILPTAGEGRDLEYESSRYDAREVAVVHAGLVGDGCARLVLGNMVISCFDLTVAVLGHRGRRAPDFLVHDSHLFDGVDERQVARAGLGLSGTVSWLGAWPFAG